MKRDMDLVRDLMKDLEAGAPGRHVTGNELVGRDRDEATVAEHLRLLIDEGFVDGEVSDVMSGGPPGVIVTGITWKGHEFLSATGDDTIWNAAKEKAAKIGGKVSVGVMVKLASAIAAAKLGLGS